MQKTLNYKMVVFKLREHTTVSFGSMWLDFARISGGMFLQTIL